MLQEEEEVTLVCSGAYGATKTWVKRMSEAQQNAAVNSSSAQPLRAANHGSSIQLMLILSSLLMEISLYIRPEMVMTKMDIAACLKKQHVIHFEYEPVLI